MCAPTHRVELLLSGLKMVLSENPDAVVAFPSKCFGWAKMRKCERGCRRHFDRFEEWIGVVQGRLNGWPSLRDAVWRMYGEEMEERHCTSECLACQFSSVE